MLTMEAPATPSETLRGSIARVSSLPAIGDDTEKNPVTSAWKGDWDKWEDWDQWQDSHK
mgnify:CR=1 FL=1